MSEPNPNPEQPEAEKPRCHHGLEEGNCTTCLLWDNANAAFAQVTAERDAALLRVRRSTAAAYRRGLERAIEEIRDRANALHAAESDIDAVAVIEDVLDALAHGPARAMWPHDEGDGEEATNRTRLAQPCAQCGHTRQDHGRKEDECFARPDDQATKDDGFCGCGGFVETDVPHVVVNSGERT